MPQQKAKAREREARKVTENVGIAASMGIQPVSALYQVSCTEALALQVFSLRLRSKEKVATTIGRVKAKERMDGKERETEIQKGVSTLPRSKNIMQLGQTMTATTMMIGMAQVHKRNTITP